MSPTPSDTNARREIYNDLVSGALCLFLSAGLAVAHFSQGGRLHDDYGREPGPALLPQVLLVLLALVGAGLLIRGIWAAAQEGSFIHFSREATLSDGSSWLALLLLAAFPPLREFIGAAPALSVIGASLAALAARGGSSSILRSAIAGAICAAALYALFKYALSVPL